ncbi:hypothetical protein HJG54_29325 [Leptolyngbya sp. NK1-12]|uniref:Uncharacterized protein n=1 Tax=Leptolyngbya sp. NK1-12 TaxID=2547451 RepID=A0AA96WJD8_9CYAN|nr:hypothetical protein [Leptolyngbya sp. NK1-12]WNZ27022.1 hypothetical protein HJG54_29325 [Leptolyngbya sp. NK1-12]
MPNAVVDGARNIRFGLTASNRDVDIAPILAKVGLTEFAEALLEEQSLLKVN